MVITALMCRLSLRCEHSRDPAGIIGCLEGATRHAKAQGCGFYLFQYQQRAVLVQEGISDLDGRRSPLLAALCDLVGQLQGSSPVPSGPGQVVSEIPERLRQRGHTECFLSCAS